MALITCAWLVGWTSYAIAGVADCLDPVYGARLSGKVDRFRFSGGARSVLVEPIRCGALSATGRWKAVASEPWIHPDEEYHSGRFKLKVVVDPSRRSEVRRGYVAIYQEANCGFDTFCDRGRWIPSQPIRVEQEAAPPEVSDKDSDGVVDASDNCPDNFNPSQGDVDADGVGDICEGDRDRDGVPDDEDNCVDRSNADQRDTDSDGRGDLCDVPGVDACGLIVVRDQYQNVSFSPAGGVGMIDVGTSVEQKVKWTIRERVSWLRVTFGKRGNGTGSVQFGVAPNYTTSPRTAAVEVREVGKCNPVIVTVAQDAGSPNPSCATVLQPTIDALSVNFPIEGGVRCAGIANSSSCPWYVDYIPSWLEVTDLEPVTGEGRICVSVTPNPLMVHRADHVVISGVPIQIYQPSEFTDLLPALLPTLVE